MSLPITIENQSYFVSWPSIEGFGMFKDYLAHQFSLKLRATIPNDLPTDELRRRMLIIAEECDAINPVFAMSKLADSREGTALLFYGWLRNKSPGVTLDWAKGLIERCDAKEPAALLGVRALNDAIATTIELKKKEIADLLAKQPPPSPSTSTPSMSE